MLQQQQNIMATISQQSFVSASILRIARIEVFPIKQPYNFYYCDFGVYMCGFINWQFSSVLIGVVDAIFPFLFF